MLTLPIPLIVALALGFLILRHVMAEDRQWLFLGLMGACAVQALIISLVQHYGVAGLAPVQPVTAACVPALAWLAFQSAASRLPVLAKDWVHGLGPAFVGFCKAFVPETLDIVLPMLFLGYGAAMVWSLRAGETMPRARLSSGSVSVLVWRGMAVLLVLSALSDMVISVAFILGQGHLRGLIISVFTSFNLAAIGALSLSPHVESDPETDAADPVEADADDAAMVAALDAHMAGARPYLDPDLTLARLARQQHVPIKRLSAAINRVKGENVSRYVNRFRIEHACRLLQAGERVTEAMLASGFNTKSNFNREFLRVTGQSPSAYLGGS